MQLDFVPMVMYAHTFIHLISSILISDDAIKTG